MTSGTPNYLDNYFEATSRSFIIFLSKFDSFLNFSKSKYTAFACPRPEGSFCNVINPFCSLSLLIFFPLTIIGTIGYFVIGALVCKFALKKQKWVSFFHSSNISKKTKIQFSKTIKNRKLFQTFIFGKCFQGFGKMEFH